MKRKLSGAQATSGTPFPGRPVPQPWPQSSPRPPTPPRSPPYTPLLPVSHCRQRFAVTDFPCPRSTPTLKVGQGLPSPSHPRSCSTPLSTLSPNMRHLSLMTCMSSVSWGALQWPLHPSMPVPRIAGGLSHCCLAEPPGSQMASAFGKQGRNPPRHASTF